MEKNLHLSVLSAIQWVSDILNGMIGTTVAVLAVGGLGLAMMQGHIPVRRGALTVIGCFILFSAPIIATALLNAFVVSQGQNTIVLQSDLPTYAVSVAPPVAYDPYAGASVPLRPQDNTRDFLPK